MSLHTYVYQQVLFSVDKKSSCASNAQFWPLLPSSQATTQPAEPDAKPSITSPCGVSPASGAPGSSGITGVYGYPPYSPFGTNHPNRVPVEFFWITLPMGWPGYSPGEPEKQRGKGLFGLHSFEYREAGLLVGSRFGRTRKHV